MSELTHDNTKNETIVLFNKRANNYALWVGCKIMVVDDDVIYWPFVIETGYSVEYITTQEEFLKYYNVIGVL